MSKEFTALKLELDYIVGEENTSRASFRSAILKDVKRSKWSVRARNLGAGLFCGGVILSNSEVAAGTSVVVAGLILGAGGEVRKLITKSTAVANSRGLMELLAINETEEAVDGYEDFGKDDEDYPEYEIPDMVKLTRAAIKDFAIIDFAEEQAMDLMMQQPTPLTGEIG